MKKLFLTIVVAAASLTASAQAYVGGEVGFWRNADDNHTSLTIHPEVGYQLSSKWDLGFGFGYSHDYNKGFKTNSVQIDPYARWSYAKLGPVSLFLEMGFGVNAYKAKFKDEAPSDALIGWRIGVQPGVKVSLCKNLDFIVHVGFLGYRNSEDEHCSYGEDGFGFNLSGNNLNFGLIYNF